MKTSPASIAKHAIELVRHRFSSSDVALEWDVDADLPDIACEPSLFEYAFARSSDVG